YGQLDRASGNSVRQNGAEPATGPGPDSGGDGIGTARTEEPRLGSSRDRTLPNRRLSGSQGRPAKMARPPRRDYARSARDAGRSDLLPRHGPLAARRER